MSLAAQGENHRALRLVADQLVKKAQSGDLAAIALLLDRTDGRVPQPVGGSDELGPTRLHITWKANDPNDLVPVNAAPALIEQHELQTIAANQAAQAIDKVE